MEARGHWVLFGWVGLVGIGSDWFGWARLVGLNSIGWKMKPGLGGKNLNVLPFGIIKIGMSFTFTELVHDYTELHSSVV